MNKIKGNFGNKYNKIQAKSGQVWQSRFYDEGLTSVEEIKRKINYIRNNPVREEIVYTPGDYEYSSYNYYQGRINNYFIDMPD
jgi:negative regulator of sigma E activity